MTPATKISKNSTVTLWLVIILIAASSRGAWVLGGRLASIDSGMKSGQEAVGVRLDAAEKERAVMREEIVEAAADQWPRQDAKNYHDMLNRINPDVDFAPIPEAGR